MQPETEHRKLILKSIGAAAYLIFVFVLFFAAAVIVALGVASWAGAL